MSRQITLQDVDVEEFRASKTEDGYHISAVISVKDTDGEEIIRKRISYDETDGRRTNALDNILTRVAGISRSKLNM